MIFSALKKTRDPSAALRDREFIPKVNFSDGIISCNAMQNIANDPSQPIPP